MRFLLMHLDRVELLPEDFVRPLRHLPHLAQVVIVPLALLLAEIVDLPRPAAPAVMIASTWRASGRLTSVASTRLSMMSTRSGAR